MIYKYVPKSNRGTVQWKYFEKHFPYILETMGSDGKRLPMIRGYVQVPPLKGSILYKLKKMRTRVDIDQSWTLKKIVDWSRVFVSGLYLSRSGKL